MSTPGRKLAGVDPAARQRLDVTRVYTLGSPVISYISPYQREPSSRPRPMTPAEIAESEEQAERWQGYEDADRSPDPEDV